MLDNSQIVDSFVVVVTENYFNERPVTIIVDLAKLPLEHGYRRAVIDALNSEQNSTRVIYETLGSYLPEAEIQPKDVVTIQGTVFLVEDSMLEEDGYTIVDDDDFCVDEAPDLTEDDQEYLDYIDDFFRGFNP